MDDPLNVSFFASSPCSTPEAQRFDALGVVFITVPSVPTTPSSTVSLAQTLAFDLVEQRLCACANIVPLIQSFYHWQGDIQNDAESLLIVKTHQDKLEAISQYLKAHHPYEVPELIFMPVTAGATNYLAWWLTSMQRPAAQAEHSS